MRKVAVAIAVLALLGVGCGGGDDSEEGGANGDVSGPQAGAQKGSGGAGGSGREEGGSADGGERQGRAEEGGRQATPGGSERPDAGGAGGGSQGEDSGAPGGGPEGSSPAQARFAKQANAICARSQQEGLQALQAYAKQNRGESSQERLEGALKEAYVPVLEKQNARLRRLSPPPGDAAQVDAIIDSMEGWVALAKREGQSAKAEIDKRIARTAQLARGYGLTRCSSA